MPEQEDEEEDGKCPKCKVGNLQDYTPVDREEYGTITVCHECKSIIVDN